MRACTVLGGLATLLIAGCMPVSMSYYRPSAQGATIHGSLCGRGGPKDTAAFSAGAAGLAVRLSTPRDGTLHVIVQIRLPDGHRAHMATDSLQLDGIEHSLGAARTWDPATGKVAEVRGTLTGSGQADGSPFRSQQRRPRTFTYEVEAGRASAARRHLLRLPPVIVDGTVHRLPEITFTPHDGVFVSPINC